MATIGVVVPVYQGEPTLEELHRQVTAQLTALTAEWEIVYVDDGSRDRSWPMLEAVRRRRPARQGHQADPQLRRARGHHRRARPLRRRPHADHGLRPAGRPGGDPGHRRGGAAERRRPGADPADEAPGSAAQAAGGPHLLRRRAVLREGALRPPGRQLPRPVAPGRGLLPRVPRADAERQRDHGDHGRADHDHRRAAPGRAPPAAAATRSTAPPGSPSTCWSAIPRCRCSWW